ncbi:uncharacterized protein LOC111698917, partial [Eurytemora carolleeae]|uniref:uncharacterized protein LOC111698917 n=1 Tax=Eurytemora carolleeae TaxID=1294199 RepID=UPI000C757823
MHKSKKKKMNITYTDESVLLTNRSEDIDLNYNTTRSNVSLVELYKSFLPVILLTCLTALLLNLAIMTAILSSAHLLKFRSSRGYLPTVTSLVCADTLTSLMLGLQLFCGSYLPVVMNIIPPPCLMLPLGCIRLGAVITTVM